MPILPLTEENFEQEALQAEGPVLVDLFAAWCGPCRALAPVLETLAEARPELRIGKVDVDAQPELAARFDVLTVPTLLLFRSGRLLRRTTGAKTLTELEEFLRSGGLHGGSLCRPRRTGRARSRAARPRRADGADAAH